jgi:hypothetical protein
MSASTAARCCQDARPSGACITAVFMSAPMSSLLRCAGEAWGALPGGDADADAAAAAAVVTPLPPLLLLLLLLLLPCAGRVGW